MLLINRFGDCSHVAMGLTNHHLAVGTSVVGRQARVCLASSPEKRDESLAPCARSVDLRWMRSADAERCLASQYDERECAISLCDVLGLHFTETPVSE